MTMPTVRVSDATFDNLKTISRWIGTTTPAETLDRVVRGMMEQLGLERDEPEGGATPTVTGATAFETGPGLTFTKPLSASVNGKSIRNPNWFGIRLAMIAELKDKGLKGEKLAQELDSGAKAERHEEEGFKYYPDLGISVQGRSAAETWKELDRLAKKWAIPLIIEFCWRQNSKAQHPGQVGLLRSGGA